jgi:hypothetical protein
MKLFVTGGAGFVGSACVEHMNSFCTEPTHNLVADGMFVCLGLIAPQGGDTCVPMGSSARFVARFPAR